MLVNIDNFIRNEIPTVASRLEQPPLELLTPTAARPNSSLNVVTYEHKLMRY
jgi:hypothetical protein